MIIIQDILVSDDIIEQQFLCNLNACKGACCWEGDSGAPLEEEEMQTLDRIYKNIKGFLTPEGKAAIKEQGKYVYFKEAEEYGTTLIANKACAYMTYNELGIAQCGIEQAHMAGATDFLKPISCHFYPIRITQDDKVGFLAMNYDRWDICSAACDLGKKEKLLIYRFVKPAIVRKFGIDFYAELDAAAKHVLGK